MAEVTYLSLAIAAVAAIAAYVRTSENLERPHGKWNLTFYFILELLSCLDSANWPPSWSVVYKLHFCSPGLPLDISYQGKIRPRASPKIWFVPKNIDIE